MLKVLQCCFQYLDHRLYFSSNDGEFSDESVPSLRFKFMIQIMMEQFAVILFSLNVNLKSIMINYLIGRYIISIIYL